MSDRIKKYLTEFVRSLVAPLDYYAFYAARATSQNGDGTLELKPEDARMPNLSKVAIFCGTPDTVVTIEDNARVMFGFVNGNPREPYVAAFASSQLGVLTIGSAGGTAQFVAIENLVKSEISKVRDSLNSHITGYNTHMHTMLVALSPIAVSGAVGTISGTSGTPVSTSTPPDPVGDVKAATVKVR